MTMISTSDGTRIFYKDWGPRSAQPIVFHHGWPLSADDWDNQMLFFVGQGFRVIAHDRRGHGRSTQTSEGNEMDTYAADVAELAAQLDSIKRVASAVGDGAQVVATLHSYLAGAPALAAAPRVPAEQRAPT